MQVITYNRREMTTEQVRMGEQPENMDSSAMTSSRTSFPLEAAAWVLLQERIVTFWVEELHSMLAE